MMLPKINPKVGENVVDEAARNPVKYVSGKALLLNKENRVLSRMVDKLATQLSEGDTDEYNHLYYAMILVLNVVNTQMEVNELKEMYS
jgi:hypothetical protein